MTKTMSHCSPALLIIIFFPCCHFLLIYLTINFLTFLAVTRIAIPRCFVFVKCWHFFHLLALSACFTFQARRMIGHVRAGQGLDEKVALKSVILQALLLFVNVFNAPWHRDAPWALFLYFCTFVKKKRKKRKVRIKDGLEGLPTRWTFLAIHEEVVERGMKM